MDLTARYLQSLAPPSYNPEDGNFSNNLPRAADTKDGVSLGLWVFIEGIISWHGRPDTA